MKVDKCLKIVPSARRGKMTADSIRINLNILI